MYKRSHAGVPEDAMPNSDHPRAFYANFALIFSSLSLSLAIDVKTILGRLGIRRPPLVAIVSQPVRHLVSRVRVGTCVAIVARIDRAKNKAGRMRRGGRREEERKRGYRTRGTCPMALRIRVGRDRIWKFVHGRAKGF